MSSYVATLNHERRARRARCARVNVGIKELKNSLSRYLRAVRNGEVILVTERGRVVAEIRRRSATQESEEDRALRALEEEGLLTRGRRGRPSRGSPVRLPRGVIASKMVSEDRGD